MWRKWLNNIIEVSSENQQQLVSNLRPLLHLMKIFGIDLDLSQPYSTCRRYGFVILSILAYAFVVWFNYTDMFDPELSHTSAKYWITFIVIRTWFIWNYLFPLVMAYMATFNWKNLWLAIEHLERYVNYPTSSLRQLRRVSIGLIALAIGLVNRIFLLFWLYSTPKAKFNSNHFSQVFTIGVSKDRYLIIEYLFNGNWVKALVSTGRTFVDFYEWAVICLFVLVTVLSSISLQVIIGEVKNPLPPIGNSSNTQLKKWGQKYGHIFILNQQNNKCFGMFLLISYLKQMITMQEQIFVLNNQILSSDRPGSTYILFFILLSKSLPCVIIMYGSHKIKNKVF